MRSIVSPLGPPTSGVSGSALHLPSLTSNNLPDPRHAIVQHSSHSLNNIPNANDTSQDRRHLSMSTPPANTSQDLSNADLTGASMTPTVTTSDTSDRSLTPKDPDNNQQNPPLPAGQNSNAHTPYSSHQCISSMPGRESRSQSFSISNPPPPSLTPRRLRALHKKHQRLSSHLFSFISLTVVITPRPRVAFCVTVDANMTVDFLAQMVEAEYYFRFRRWLRRKRESSNSKDEREEKKERHSSTGSYGTPTGAASHISGAASGTTGSLQDSKSNGGGSLSSAANLLDHEPKERSLSNSASVRGAADKMKKLAKRSVCDAGARPEDMVTGNLGASGSSATSAHDSRKDTAYLPLSVGLLLDGSSTPLEFERKIGDVLGLWDVIYVVNTYEDLDTSFNVAATAPYLSLDSALDPDTFNWSLDVSGSSKMSTLPSLNAFTSSTTGLQHLILFSIWDYAVESVLFWLDTEVLLSSPSPSRAMFEYIYLVYLCSHAPLRITLSEDIRQEISSCIISGSSLDMSLFDEAQEQTLALIRCYLLPRFESSEVGEAWRENKGKGDRVAMGAYAISGEEEMVQQLRSMEERATRQLDLKAKMKTTAAGRGRRASASNSEHTDEEGDKKHPTFDELRQDILLQTLARYERGLTTVLTTEAVDYFPKKRKATETHRLRRVLKEKKLAKFFGDRTPGVGQDEEDDEIWLNHAAIGFRDEDGNLPLQESFSVGQPLFPSLIVEEEDEDMEGSEANTKLRKAAKLREFFGGAIPQAQLADQRLLVGETLRSKFTHGLSHIHLSHGPAPSEPLEDLNDTHDLSPAQKRELTKRSKKLHNYFGENVMSQGQVRTRTRSPHMKAVDDHESEAGSVDDVLELSHLSDEARKNSLHHTSDNAIAQKHSTTSPKLNTSVKKRFSASDAMLPSPPMAEVDSDKEIESKGDRRRRMEKLQHVMGEKLPESAVLNRPYSENPIRRGTVAGSKAKEKPQSIQKDSKDQQMRRAVKLEKMFGIAPPQALVECRSLRSKESIVSLQEIFRDQSKVFELLEYISAEAGMALNGGTSSTSETAEPPKKSTKGSPASPPKARPVEATNITTINRDNRKRRLNKLQKFFGQDQPLTPEMLLEQKILQEIEKSILQEEDEEEREVLHKDLNELRQVIRNSLVEMEWSEEQQGR